MLESGNAQGVFLFHGPRSVGKHTVAKEFAKLVTCSGIRDLGCTCSNCRLFPSIPDFLSIGEAEGAVKVEDAKSIESFLSLAPYSAPRRVIVIDGADRLNQQAACRLLKIFEERTSALIVLVTSDESLVPSVVSSRCVPMRFGPLSREEITEILSRQGHARQSVEDVCRAMPFFSRSVLGEFQTYNSYMKRAPALLKSMASGDTDEVLSVASTAEDAGQTVHLVETLLSCLCDVMKTHYDRPVDIACQSMAGEIEALTASWTTEACIASMARLGSVLDDIRSPLHFKIGPRLLSAVSWMSLYVTQVALNRRMVG